MSPSFKVIIPARYHSSRLPGKPLVDLDGIPMVVRTYRQCLDCLPADQIVVATDHELIANTCFIIMYRSYDFVKLSHRD